LLLFAFIFIKAQDIYGNWVNI